MINIRMNMTNNNYHRRMSDKLSHKQLAQNIADYNIIIGI